MDIPTINLEELSRRHPGVKNDTDKIIFEIPSSKPPSGGGKKKLALRIVRDTSIGVLVTFIVLGIMNYFPV